MSASHLLDAVIAKHGLKHDADLSRFLGFAPPIICKLRHMRFPVGATHILRIHEKTGMPVAAIRELIAEEQTK